MQDTTNGNSIYVSTDGDSVPYIMLPLSQLDAVKALLQHNAVDFWVDENAVAIDGEPYIVVINLSKSADVATVQAILDDAN